MYIFTLWNQSPMPEEYGLCIAALLNVYPSLVIEPFECPEGQRPDQFSDFIRFQRLAEITEDALYIDADCTPNDPFTGGGRPALANLRGGTLDIWAIYKPKGFESIFADALRQWKPYGHIQSYVNVKAHLFDRIAGYPDNRFFSHLHLGGATSCLSS